MRGILAVTTGLAMTLGLTGGAFASGGLACSNVGGDTGIEVNAGVARGMGSPIFSLNGQVELKDQGVAEDLRKTEFKQEHAAQYWLDGEDLRLRLYRERDPNKEHAYVELEILAKATPDGENTYDGTYGVAVWDGAGGGEPQDKRFDGKISCFVE